MVMKYTYSSGGSGNLPTSQATSAVTHTGSTSLLEFDSLTYNDNNDLARSTPKVSGTTETADTYTYYSQQRVISGPETSGSDTAYSYTNSNTDTYPMCSQPFCSTGTVDQMGIDAMPDPGSAAQLGAEYAGNGELRWVAHAPSSTTGSCSSPGSSASSYETLAYNSSEISQHHAEWRLWCNELFELEPRHGDPHLRECIRLDMYCAVVKQSQHGNIFL